MSSKKMFEMRRLKIFLFLTIFCSLISVYCFSEIIDRIIAVVNEQVITLTDVRVVEAFGLYEDEFKGRSESPRMLILEKLIDQKLVIQLSGLGVSAGKEELDSSLKEMEEKMGSEEVERKLAEFGMDLNDLREYIREKIVYQTILTRKFSYGNIVNVKEIEDYYKKIYIPFQREKGEEPRPMMELLDEIESVIKEEKMKTQIYEWIKNLREKADIQIKLKS